jgi:hypothetical protein
MMKVPVFLSCLAWLSGLSAADPKAGAVPMSSAIQPSLCLRGKILFEDDFTGSLKPEWVPSYKTRWAAAGGVLTGQPATEADQAAAHDKQHGGSAPSIQLNVPARDCIVAYEFKLGPKNTAQNIVFNDGTHLSGTGHVSSVQFHVRLGVVLSKKKNTKQDGDADVDLSVSDWKPVAGKWYQVMEEMRGDTIVVRISGGPSLKAKDPRFDIPKTFLSLGAWGGDAISYRNFRIWADAPDAKLEALRDKGLPKSPQTKGK